MLLILNYISITTSAQNIKSLEDSTKIYFNRAGIKIQEGKVINGTKEGFWRFYFTSGNIDNDCNYEHDKLNGTKTFYDSATGNIKRSLNYHYDIMDGYCINYDSVTGHKKSEGSYQYGKHIGEWMGYNTRTGKLLAKWTYSDDNTAYAYYYDSLGKIASEGGLWGNRAGGLWKYYIPATGKVFSTETYVNGVLQGHAEYYDEVTGMKYAEGEHVNNKRKGEWTFYFHSNGKLKSTETYEGMVLNGPAKYYDSITQKLIKEAEFDNDKRIGKWKYYTSTGNLQDEENYKNGELDGELKIYDSLGGAYLSRYYKEGKKQGKTRINYPYTKQLWIDCNVTADSMDGDLKAYYPSGKLKRKEAYNNGALVSSVCYSERGEEIAYTPLIIQSHFDGDVMTYIGNNLKYPEDAEGAEGKVTVGFVVNESGLISDVNIVKGVNERLDNEAMRLVSQMPPWIPSQLDGKAYKEYKSLPIVFWKH